jgi:hypothetical protein
MIQDYIVSNFFLPIAASTLMIITQLTCAGTTTCGKLTVDQSVRAEVDTLSVPVESITLMQFDG